MNKVSVVLLNYNGRHFLEKFLPALVRYSPGCDIVVADNASRDGSLEFVRSQYPQIRIIPFSYNKGFCEGYNDALKQVESEYYILLNTDVETTENWIDPVIRFMDQNERVAVCQPKVLSYADRSYFEYAGAAGGFIDAYGYPFCRGRIFDALEKDTGQYDDVRPVFWATGACFFVRAKLFHSFGGFDARFFAHMEEIDLCWRLNDAGYQAYYVGQSTVYHVGGGALPASSPRKTYLNFRNNLLMVHKNLSRREAVVKLPIRLALDYAAGLSFLPKNPRKTLAVLKAHKDFLLEVLKAPRRRKKAGKLRRRHHSIYPGSIVAAYYLRGKKRFSQLEF